MLIDNKYFEKDGRLVNIAFTNEAKDNLENLDKVLEYALTPDIWIAKDRCRHRFICREDYYVPIVVVTLVSLQDIVDIIKRKISIDEPYRRSNYVEIHNLDTGYLDKVYINHEQIDKLLENYLPDEDDATYYEKTDKYDEMLKFYKEQLILETVLKKLNEER